MTLEISLERRACTFLISRNALPEKEGFDGKPDRLVLWGDGRHFWIEFKKESTGRLRAMQKQWQKYLERIGDKVYIVDRFEQVVHIVATWEAEHGPAHARRL